MKSVVNEADKKVKSEYPCLKITSTNTSRLIVLFHSEKVGVVVNCHNSSHYVGYYGQRWYEEGFTPFNGTVTLSND